MKEMKANWMLGYAHLFHCLSHWFGSDYSQQFAVLELVALKWAAAPLPWAVSAEWVSLNSHTEDSIDSHYSFDWLPVA